MKHASSTTFLNHYRPRRHVSMQEHMLGLPPDKEFERAVTSISRWIDKWRPRYLNDMEKASVERDPELQAAIQRREDLADEYEHSQDPTLIPLLRERQQDVTNTRRRLQYKRRKEVRQEFSRKQAVIDIERQLSGSAVHDEDDREFSQAEYEMPPAQIRLVEKLLVVPTSWSLEAEWQRRHEAVEAIKEYCDFLEGGPLRGRPKRSVPRDGEITRASNQNVRSNKRNTQVYLHGRQSSRKPRSTSRRRRSRWHAFNVTKRPLNIRASRGTSGPRISAIASATSAIWSFCIRCTCRTMQRQSTTFVLDCMFL
ncbi:hypothetical protein V6Z79_008273 [Aspergillus fumigatus]